MLISREMNAALNAQIGREFGAMLQYVAIAAYFEAENLPRLARFFFQQADDEREHAMRFVRYVVEAGGRVEVPATPGARGEFGGAEEPVRLSLEWEQEVTRQIHGLLAQAVKEGDYTTQEFLQWFVREQLEEVSTMERLLSVVRRAGPQLLLVEDFLAREGHPHGAGEEEE